MINDKDKQILGALDGNSRMSVSRLARGLNLSKDGVNYRLKRLEGEEIITKYFAEVDVSKLGLIMGKVAMQFQNADKQKEDEIFNFLKSQPKVGWVIFCSGRWDCVFVAYVKDNYEFKELIDVLVEKYGEHILAKEFLLMSEYYVVNRKWLLTKHESYERAISKIGGKINKSVDELDIEIIKILTKNCRTPIIEIAKKLNVSSSLIINRIRELENKKVIQNYYVGLNLEKVKKEFCKSFIYLRNYSKEERKKLEIYCLSHPNVTAITNLIGQWEMELEMEVDNFDEFHRIMNGIKEKFKNIVRSYEAIVITREYGRDYSTII